MRWQILVALMLCISVAGCRKSGTGGSTTNTTAEPAEKVELEIKSWDETQELIAEHKGKIVVLDVWSTTCGPCMKEFPNLVKLHNKRGGNDLACMSMSIDYYGIKNEPPESYRKQVMAFLEKQNATLQNVLCSDPCDEWYDAVDLGSAPVVFVYGRDGKLAKRFDNEDITDEEGFTYEDVNKLVERLLAEE